MTASQSEFQFMLPEFQIPTPDASILEKLQQKIDFKTKPPGSLGRLEALAKQIGGAQNSLNPCADPAKLLLFAADHGLVQEGVSAWPSEVTTQMVVNFLSGGAAANVFAKTNNIEIAIVDAGIAGDLDDHPNLLKANIAKGTRNALHEDAMSAQQVKAALSFGANLAMTSAQGGINTIAIGEMGIGNTSSASLLAAAVEGIDIAALTGPGAGLDDEGVAKKIDILRRVLARKPGKLEPFDALCAFGGLEIAAMTGAIIGAAAHRTLTLVDGFIASAAAMLALRARPEIVPYLVFAHQSKEPGHRLMLAAIDAHPLMELDLRLGEGTGALLAFPLLRNACAMVNEMATFESAGVSGKDD